MSIPNETFRIAVEHLKLKFPIAKISKALNYSKGAVSEYYNGKKEMSEKFIEQFENHYKIKLSDFETESLTSQPEPKSEMLVIQKKLIQSQEERIKLLEKELKKCQESLFFEGKPVHRDS